MILLEHGTHDSAAFPLFWAVPREVGTSLFGFRLIGGATTEETDDQENSQQQKEIILRSLDR